MKKNEIKKLDKLWSDKVKERAGYKCEFCYKDKYVNAHHVFSRAKRSVRWDVENGVALCAGCHTFSSIFSAHQTPTEFTEWIRSHRGEEWYHRLRKKAYTVVQAKNQDFEEIERCLNV